MLTRNADSFPSQEQRIGSEKSSDKEMLVNMSVLTLDFSLLNGTFLCFLCFRDLET